jgi:hypothetical protein
MKRNDAEFVKLIVCFIVVSVLIMVGFIMYYHYIRFIN